MEGKIVAGFPTARRSFPGAGPLGLFSMLFRLETEGAYDIPNLSIK
jgi:hypothetical protein